MSKLEKQYGTLHVDFSLTFALESDENEEIGSAWTRDTNVADLMR